MSTVSITINTDNAAFYDEGTATELARILSELTAYVVASNDVDVLDGKRLRDGNGNTVGRVAVTTPESYKHDGTTCGECDGFTFTDDDGNCNECGGSKL